MCIACTQQSVSRYACNFQLPVNLLCSTISVTRSAPFVLWNFIELWFDHDLIFSLVENWKINQQNFVSHLQLKEHFPNPNWTKSVYSCHPMNGSIHINRCWVWASMMLMLSWAHYSWEATKPFGLINASEYLNRRRMTVSVERIRKQWIFKIPRRFHSGTYLLSIHKNFKQFRRIWSHKIVDFELESMGTHFSQLNMCSDMNIRRGHYMV